MPYDSLAVVAAIMNERPMDDVVAMATYRNYVYNRVKKTSKAEDFYGKYAKLVLQDDTTMNAGPRAERGDVPQPGLDNFAEQHITLFQYMNSIGWTDEEARHAVRTNKAAVIDLVEFKMKNAPNDMRWKLNHAFQSDGTGRLARVSAYNAGSMTVDNTVADFGWDKCNFLKNGMIVDVYTVGGIVAGTSQWTCKALQCKITGINRSAGTFTIAAQSNVTTSFLGTAGNVPADGDFVFISNSALLSSGASTDTTGYVPTAGATPYFRGWLHTPGLMTIIDDGVTSAGNEFNAGGAIKGYNGNWNGTTFQNLNRTLYPQLQAQIMQANDWGGGTAGTAQTCSIREIQDVIRGIDEEGEGGGLISCLYMNGATRDWLTEAAAATKTVTISQTEEIIPGVKGATMFRTSEGREIPVVPCPTMPNGTIAGIDESDMILFESVPLDWKNYGDMGRIFPSPGTRNLTFESWMQTELVLAANACWNAFRMEDIDITV
jgi:hypothetical protein